ncbi:MAG TPA: enoyl-CoA hydratase/isomerase family protein [Solirubrobacteraceae bacterium]|nr:enoyl-CoA hydratase/isomerase family protein [Solirubrobacteraceae bacterium]
MFASADQSASEQQLTYQVEQHVAWVIIDRPDRINALTKAMMQRLTELAERAHHDPDVRVMAICATGTRGFCAGRDLKERPAPGADHETVHTPMRGTQRNMFEAVLECGKPTVAGIFGHTLGAGAELALACDVLIAAEDLRFGLPEAKLGLGATFATQMLPRIVPRSVAFDLLYTARTMDATEALARGLVCRVVARDSLDDAVREWTKVVAANAPLSTRRYKAMIARGLDLPIAAALRLDVGPDPYLSSDRDEGRAAWTQKRPPEWRGR